jgi:prepilin-type N-terminal cleavage/methylation domain-containing protein
MHRTAAAFTLIELLVVVTMIAILLAVLSPALDQAMYQAELSICAAGLATVVGSSVFYAMDHKRAYPVRNYSLNNRDQRHVAGPHKDVPAIYEDERHVLRGYIYLNKMLQCPLSTPIELEETAPNADVLHGYLTWYGWR